MLIQQSIKEYLDTVISVYDLFDPQMALKHIIGNFSLLDFFSNLKESNTALEQLSNRSYKHENGFDKIVLIDEDKYKLRLHVWKKSTIEYNENIHDHRWDFCSYILTGGYMNEVYQEDETGSDFEEYHYYPKLNKQSYPLHFIKLNKLILTSSSLITMGAYNFCPIHTLHRVRPNKNSITISILLQGPPVLKYARVLNKKGVIINTEDIKANSMNKDYLYDLLSEIEIELYDK